MTRAIRLQITARGGVQMLHDDRVNLAELGPVRITRASHVEWHPELGWYVESARTGFVIAQGFPTRAAALDWEYEHYSPGRPGWDELTKR